jgi:excisionase family DNA binding protein
MKISDYMTISEAAEFLGVNSSTMRNWEKQGKIKVYRNPMSNYRLYKRDEMVEVLASIETLMNFANDSLQKEEDNL